MRGTKSTRVVVFTDDRLLRENIVCSVGRETDLRIDVQPIPESDSLPVVVLLDSRMEGALRTCSALRLSMFVSVILIETPTDDSWAIDALAAGARGMVAAGASSADLTAAIRVVREGQIWAPRRIVVARLDQLAQSKAPESVPASALEERLSAREREVFRQAIAGLANKEVAGRLSISESTVKVHLTHIFQKLGVSGRAELAAAYFGLLPDRASRSSSCSHGIPFPSRSSAIPPPIPIGIRPKS